MSQQRAYNLALRLVREIDQHLDSGRHVYAQVVNDVDGKTLAAASTLSRDLKGTLGEDRKIDAAKKVGALIAKICLEKKIAKVVFDRNGYLYHGRVKALAEAAREAGLKF